MSSLRLFLLGPLRVEVDDSPIEVKRRKALALLVYLALTGQAQRRDTLATLLWPDSSQSRARAALRRELSILNKALAGNWLMIERETIGLKTKPGFWLDVEQFQQRAADCADASPTCLEILTQAVELYRDDFLTGFTLTGCYDFDEWQFFQSEGLRQELAAALERLVDGLSTQGRYDQAIPYARRRLALEPLHEPAHRKLMRLYVWSGQRAAALRQYQQCVRVLDEELEAPPAEKTTTLYEAIKSKRPPPAPPQAEARRGSQALGPPATSLTEDLIGEEVQAFAPLWGERVAVGGQPSPAGVTHFVARERELARLNQFLRSALAGQGRVVFVTGEAGSGKTTLIHEFARLAQFVSPDLVVAIGTCNVYTGVGDPYLPFREILNQLAGDVVTLALTPTNAGRLQTLTPSSIQTLVEEGSDLIGSFIAGETLLLRARGVGSVQTEWRARLKELVVRQATHSGSITPEQNRLFEQYSSVLHSLSTRQPMLLILDDLHWADVASISLLFHVGRRIDQRRILIIGSYRPEDVARGSSGQSHPLDGVLSEFKRHFGDTWLDLDQAGAGAGGRAFVDALLDSEANRLGEVFRQALYQHSRGHPLFTVELLRVMQERDDLVQDEQGRWIQGSSLAWDTLPARVEGVIERRISRLDTELQEALNVASVEGEVFTAEVVAKVQALDERGLVRRLSGELDKQHRLVQEQGLQHVGTLRLSRYQFRHNLFQKYLYDRLGQAERAYLHEAVGNTLETLYQNQTVEIAVQLARHFQEAGLMDKAIDYLLQAGQRATRLSANEEAIVHINQGLVLLKSLPDTLGRAQQELTLLLALSRPLTRLKGYSAPEVEQPYRRAWEICQQIGDTPERFPVLRGLWDYHLVRAEGYKAHELGWQFLEMARRVDDPILLMEAHWLLGETLFFMGEITAALTHQEEAIARYNSQQYRAYPYRAAQDPGLASRYFRAENLWFLGYPDQALATIHDTLTLAQDLAQPFEIANTLFFVIRVYQARREVQAAQAHVENFVALAKEHGFEMWVPISMGQRGWLLAGQGQLEEGIVQMEQGQTAHLETTAGGLGLAMSAHTLVEAYARARHVEKGLEFLSRVLSEVEKSGYRLYEAELYRLKGELFQMQDADESEVEACFRQAIDISGRQQAKLLELRATVSLSRLWQKQGKPDEARQMLAEIYSWFSEGFDTADLIEARELFEELNRSADRSTT